MLAALASERPDGERAMEAALIIGGARDPVELAAMKRSLGAMLDGIARDLAQGDAASRGRALLAALFVDRGGRPLLQHYEADATTLYDVMTTGRFNCVSATTLYLLLAARAGIDARAILLPSHARAVVVASGRRFVVETTTANGFDAPASVAREARDRVRPTTKGEQIDLYADEKGTEVDFKALLAVTYGNLSIAAENRGDTPLAAALLSREVVLTPAAQAPIVRLQQMSLLSELATRKYNAGELAPALAFARRAYDAAGDAQGKRLAEQNIAAIASRKLAEEAPRLEDGALVGFAEPLRMYPRAYGDVQAMVLTLVAQRKSNRGDLAGSAEALHAAAALASSDEMRAQAGQNAILGELNRMSARSVTDPEAAWATWKRLAPPDARIAVAQERAGAVIAENRSIKLANGGRCPELEAALVETPGVARADSLRAACRDRRGIARSDSGDLAGALEDLRAAVRLEPGDSRHRDNLVVILEKQIDRLVRSSRCGDVAALVAEGRSLAPADKFFSDTVEYCNKR